MINVRDATICTEAMRVYSQAVGSVLRLDYLEHLATFSRCSNTLIDDVGRKW